MKGDHLVQDLGIYPFELHVGVPSTTGLFHGEGDVVPEANVFAVVEASEGAGGAMARLLSLPILMLLLPALLSGHGGKSDFGGGDG